MVKDLYILKRYFKNSIRFGYNEKFTQFILIKTKGAKSPLYHKIKIKKVQRTLYAIKLQIAATLTISSTEQPRERSQYGKAKP